VTNSAGSVSQEAILPRNQPQKFDPTLSGLRGLAAFGVAVFHASNSIPMPLFALTSNLYLGVPVFLMMSMYLLLRRLDVNSDLKRYFKRRILRIWPIYFGTLIVFYVLFPYPFTDFVRYLFFVEYYVNPFGYFPVTIFWTLQLEEAAYLFIPLIHRMNPDRRRFLAYVLVLGGFAYLAAISATPWGHHDMVYLEIFLPVPLISYGMGIIAYEKKIPGSLRWLSIAGIGGYTVLTYLGKYSITMPYLQNYLVNNLLLYAIALTGFAAVVVNPPKFFRIFSLLGEESYALYAVHYAFVTIFGLAGLVYSVVCAFLIEFSLRPKEIIKRVRLSYSPLVGIPSGENVIATNAVGIRTSQRQRSSERKESAST
jgi:peptidoglycan/LPS O-acetylase OafA/YrhL